MMLYPTKGMQITSVYYLENEELKLIPYWMKYS